MIESELLKIFLISVLEGLTEIEYKGDVPQEQKFSNKVLAMFLLKEKGFKAFHLSQGNGCLLCTPLLHQELEMYEIKHPEYFI